MDTPSLNFPATMLAYNLLTLCSKLKQIQMYVCNIGLTCFQDFEWESCKKLTDKFMQKGNADIMRNYLETLEKSAGLREGEDGAQKS